MGIEGSTEVFGLILEAAEMDNNDPHHYVRITINNCTNDEWERCHYVLDGHIWKSEGVLNGEPPQRLKPKEMFSSKAVTNIVGKGTFDINFAVAYKRVGDKEEDQVIYVHVLCPFSGDNQGWNSGLTQKGKDLNYKAIEGPEFQKYRCADAHFRRRCEIRFDVEQA
jgi:hypothetical protein